MKIIIPAAGEGTRLRPHTHTQPKVLLNVAGKPILGHILDPLAKVKPSKIIFIVSSHSRKIAEFVRRNYSFKVSFVRQNNPQGLGHAVYMARSEIGDEPVLIILGDSIVNQDLFKRVQTKHDWLGVKPVKDPQRFGIAEVKNGNVRKLVEKPENPKGNLALIGLYFIRSTEIFHECLEEVIRGNITTRGEFQLTDVLQLMIEKGVKFRTVEVKEWFDCGKMETLLETNRRLLELNANSIPRLRTSLVIPPAYVSRSAKIKRSILGPNVTVLEKAEIANSVVKNSILSEGCWIHNAVLENSIIGRNARVTGRINNLNVGELSETGV